MHDRKGQVAGAWRDDGVADAAGHAGVALNAACGKGTRGIVEILRLDWARPQAGGLGLKRHGDAGCQAAATAADQHIGRVDAGGARLFRDLKARGTLTRDHLRLVEGFDQGQATLLRHAFADGVAILGRAVIEHDLGPEGAGILDLQARGVGGHDYDGRHAMLGRGQRHALRVIAR